MASTIEKVNLATERVRDSDIRALINQCPNITFLNVTENLVTLEVFHELATTYLSLPKQIATELNLTSERVRNFEYLEELPLLWRQNVVNPRDAYISYPSPIQNYSGLNVGTEILEHIAATHSTPTQLLNIPYRDCSTTLP